MSENDNVKAPGGVAPVNASPSSVKAEPARPSAPVTKRAPKAEPKVECPPTVAELRSSIEPGGHCPVCERKVYGDENAERKAETLRRIAEAQDEAD